MWKDLSCRGRENTECLGRTGRACLGSSRWHRGWHRAGLSGLGAARDRLRRGCPSNADPLELSKSVSERVVSSGRGMEKRFAVTETLARRAGHSPSPPAGSGSACAPLPSGTARPLQRQWNREGVSTELRGHPRARAAPCWPGGDTSYTQGGS